MKNNFLNYVVGNFIRWCWLVLTGEDLLVMRRQLSSLERLNDVHCQFIDQLENKYRNNPKILEDIKDHHTHRLEVLDEKDNGSAEFSEWLAENRCVNCHKELTINQQFYTNGRCVLCGYKGSSAITIVECYEKPYRLKKVGKITDRDYTPPSIHI